MLAQYQRKTFDTTQFSEQSLLGTAQEQTLAEAPHAGELTIVESAGAESMLRKEVDQEGFVISRFNCFYYQYSPCNGIRYDVTGGCTIGVKETILPSGEEQVLLRIRFEGAGQEYSFRQSHAAQFGNIANQYNVAGVRGVWNGLADLPNFQILSSGRSICPMERRSE